MRTMPPRVLFYLAAVTFSVNGVGFAVSRVLPNATGIADPFLVSTILLILLYIWAYFLYGHPFRRLRPSFRWDAFWLAMALALPISLIPAILSLMGKGNFVLEMARPGFWTDWRPLYPLVAASYWGLQGILVAYFLIGVPSELFRGAGHWRWVAPFLVVSLNYNAPLLSGNWNPFDILWLGVLWPLAYIREGAPASLALAYLLVEGPVMWAWVAPLGNWGVILFAWGRVALGVAGGLLWWRNRLR